MIDVPPIPASDDPAAAVATALAAPGLNGVTRLSAVDTVRARIALAVELELVAPGERLPPDAEIADALDVSEMTVRRALQSMAEDGLVRRRRGRNGGTFVQNGRATSPDAAVDAYRADAEEVHRLIDLRTLLECALAHHAALRATPAQWAELEEIIRDAAAAQDWASYHRADQRFHRALALCSGLEWAQEQHAAVLADLYRYFIPYPIDRLRDANEDHARLLTALRDRDPVVAVDVIRDHLQALHRTMFVGSPSGAATTSH